MTTVRESPIATRVMALTLLVVALVALASSGRVHAAVLDAYGTANRLIGQHSTLGPVVFVVLAALSAMLTFVSSAVLVPPAVIAWGPTRSALLLWIGWMLGGMAAYTLARVLGLPVVRRLVSERLLARYEEQLNRQTPFVVILLFQLAFPSELPGYLLGLARYPLSRYFAALAIAELPYAIGTVLLGESFVERRMGLLIAVGGVAVLAVFLLAGLARRRMR